jgi:hypothetical protein
LLTVEQAYARYVRRVTPELVAPDTPEIRDELTMEIGQFYRSGAVIDGRGEAEPACLHPDETRGRPGARVPHAWLGDGRSTIDCASDHPTVLAGPQAHDWIAAAEAIGLPAVTLPADASAQCALGKSGALLARPDGFVAWRAGEGHDASIALEQALAECFSPGKAAFSYIAES